MDANRSSTGNVRYWAVLGIFGFVFVTLTFISPAGASVASFTGLGDLPGGSFNSIARGVSADGSTVVGYGNSASGVEAFRWTAGGGMVGLGDLPGGSYSSEARGVSADGSVVVGGSISASGDEAFRWTSDGGMVSLGDLPGGIFDSHAFDISANGSTVVGWSSSALGRRGEAFRWTSDGGMVGLGDLPGSIFYSRANGISADGSTVVGDSYSASGREAFRWTSEGGMVGLGDLPGDDWSEAYGVSADGVVVVGESSSASGREAFIWDAANGMQSLKDVLEETGLYLTGWRLERAYGISDDGLTIVGYGTHTGNLEAWVATLPSPTLDVIIDIKPGGDVNPINLKSRGVLSVAIFGDDDLDVSEIDLATLELAGAGPAERGNSGKIGVFKDINGDSILDLLLYFDMEDMIIDEDATELTLLGMLNDGMELVGSDSIRIVPPNGKGGPPDLGLATLGLLEQPYIPEPASAALLLLGFSALLKNRKMR